MIQLMPPSQQTMHIPLNKEEIPIMKPTVHFLRKTIENAQLSEMGYTLQIQQEINYTISIAWKLKIGYSKLPISAMG
ncbi:hypothetical protein GLOIN_2v1476741 [Rhizophagus clarus]|uniref:Uncharacterized protein n=1 Tax=Rhizophagus clarus TaxID=94130 RepID=A0A8H3KP33_9GLOM|nr:hypothetical protein GLOIN_2v1476741 [Rhizophagus clarus]